MGAQFIESFGIIEEESGDTKARRRRALVFACCSNKFVRKSFSYTKPCGHKVDKDLSEELELYLKMETTLHATSTNLYARTIWNSSPLEVRVDASVATRVVLGGTNRVAVFSNNF